MRTKMLESETSESSMECPYCGMPMTITDIYDDPAGPRSVWICHDCEMWFEFLEGDL